MHRRLYTALRKSSEVRAFLVLFIVFALRTYRKIQRRCKALPTPWQIKLAMDRRILVWITYLLYEAHWI